MTPRTWLNRWYLSILVIIATVALVVSVSLPSYVITLRVENAGAEAITVIVTRLDTSETHSARLKPGASTEMKLFSGDGAEPEKWPYLGVVVNTGGQILEVRKMRWPDFRRQTWRVTEPPDTTGSTP